MNTYDAIIVGARCGGAPLAMLLARAGNKVLLLDRMAIAAFIGAFMGSVPLDQVFSPVLMNRFAEDVQRGQENRHVA